MCYGGLGQNETALSIELDVYAKWTALDPSSERTFCRALNLSVSLVGTGRYKQAKSFLREQIAAARRVLGEETSLVIRLRWNYADALCEDDSASRDDVAEAVAILEELFRTARRVLGTAHPITGSIQDSLGKAQETLAAFAPETE